MVKILTFDPIVDTYDNNGWSTTDDDMTTHGAFNGSMQALIWMAVDNPGKYNSLLNEADLSVGAEGNYGMSAESWKLLERLGEVRIAGFETVRGKGTYDDGVSDESPYKGNPRAHAANLLARWLAQYKAGELNQYTFAMYQPTGDHGGYKDQPMIARVPEEGNNTMWGKIRKVDEDGNGLANAKFTFYVTLADGNMRQIGVKATGADGWAYCEVPKAMLSGGVSSAKISAKETTPPSGYELVDKLYSAEANTTDNATQATAADLAAGGVPNPKKDGDGDADILKKIDARTGAGVGPATFTFEGQSNPHEGEDVALIAMDDMAMLSATNVQYAAGGNFELPLEGSTGWTQKSMGGLAAGTAFTIIDASGSGWKVKTKDKEVNLSASDIKCCMINMPDVMPSIVYNIVNADSAIYKSSGKSISGITGSKLYTAGKLPNARFGGESMFLVPLNYQMAQKIATAQKAALAKGMSLMIYDAYRPAAVQKSVSNGLQTLADSDKTVLDGINAGGKWKLSWFISTGVSNHQRGVSVDATLCTAQTKDVTVGDKTVKLATDGSPVASGWQAAIKPEMFICCLGAHSGSKRSASDDNTGH